MEQKPDASCITMPRHQLLQGTQETDLIYDVPEGRAGALVSSLGASGQGRRTKRTESGAVGKGGPWPFGGVGTHRNGAPSWKRQRPPLMFTRRRLQPDE